MKFHIRRMLLAAAVAVVLAVVLSVAAMADEAAPTLTEVDTLRFRTYLLTMQIAQLQAQSAQRDFDTAQQAAAILAKQLEKPGYALDWQRGVYTKSATGEK